MTVPIDDASAPGATYPADPPDVGAGLAALSQAEALASLDVLMSRRGHPHRDLAFQVAHWRRERTAWGDARDTKRDKKEAADE